jgi:hypothetical protein
MAFDTREFSFADVKVSLLGVNLTGLRGLTYKKSFEKELVYAQGNNPKAIQRKNKKFEGSLMLLKSDYDLLNRAAIAAGYDDLTEVPGHLINITCVYAISDTAKNSTVVLQNVEFTEAEDGMKQEDSFKEITLPFIYLRQKAA